MAKHLDTNEAAFLAALEQDDPQAECWTASWRLMAIAKDHGADAVATGAIEGAFAVMKNLATRKLVDKQPGRASKMDNGYALNDAGREALRLRRQAEKETGGKP